MTSTGRRTWARVWTTAVPLALAVVATLGLVDTSASAGRTGAGVAAAGVSPFNFVSYLDLECFKTSPYTPPVTTVLTRHLNPVLAGLPAENVTLGARQQLCVPVAKNGVTPPADVLGFIRFVDLSCYAISGITVNKTLTLTHLNPVLKALPVRTITMVTPQQLCVPVVKNNAFPPADVLRLVQYIDLKCYLEQPQTSLGISLRLSHLNPVLAGLAVHTASVTFNRQLCVPVQKNNQVIPDDVLNVVRWVDLEKFDIVTPALTSPVTLTLTHINPALTGLPVETAVIQTSEQLAVPVAKNGAIPPTA
ncbi:hypothetical protein [Hamadaea tsunoensis]|uniref:hypothetical protein n=1 Tax=Hamadaea tsunoensis TaxID=53368 RepID=UPI001FE22ED2|nr:hypothetical protein [Hamadaea tsunoensis]